ncbi:MAG: PD-(D/E)XK nuclease family protein [Bacteroidales bacterium]|nr:PD-(D/E)XK nuclease family protein [Bacteroidales bacterium]
MNTFLDLCVADILQKHGNDLTNTTVVFPSKRAMVFFRKSLGTQIKTPVFVPQMTTIQDFCLSRQKATIPDDFSLIFNLYDSYQKVTHTTESFEEFFPWGEMLLSDFDDIDKYLINAKDIFSNIADYKDINSVFDYLSEEQINIIKRFWEATKIDEVQENDVRKNFITFWNLLYPIYEDFNSQLSLKGFSYEGKAIRGIAESSKESYDELFGNKKYIFLGFNALSKAETKIFTTLQKRQQAYFYWDYDVYYQKDKTHEAGIFIRKNLEQFKNELEYIQCFQNFEQDKDIHVVKLPNSVAQAKYCSKLLQEIKDANSNKTNVFESTAILLADEKMIDPILSSIPNDIAYNITLGYPIRSSAAYTLFESILDMCMNKNGENLYFKDILRICENPLIPSNLQEDAAKLKKEIVKNRTITIKSDDCTSICNLPHIFNINTSIESYVKSLIDCVVEICRTHQLTAIDRSIFYTIYTELVSLQEVVNKNNIQFQKIKFINSLLKKTLQGKNIAIEGQPLEGLQVMGILESRMIDFKHIIMMSVNDGNLPKTSAGSSFIPYHLRTAFGMPTIKEQSAMYSYYFYRLIQRCEKLTIMYSENDNGKKSEKSRFIMQLLYESPFKNLDNQENPNFKKFNGIHTEDVGYEIETRKPIEWRVTKQLPEVQAYFSEIQDSTNNKALSPSSLAHFLQCELKFYFSAIKKLQVPEPVEDLTQSNEMGTYFHETMEKLYEQYLGQEITAEIINKKILTDEDGIITTIVNVMQKHHAPASVYDKESKEVKIILHQVKSLLSFDAQKTFAPITLEEQKKDNKFETIATLNLDNGKSVKIGGKIDRLDLCNGVYRIVDYKTGKCPEPEKKLTFTMDTMFGKDKNFTREAFQTSLYSYILKKNNQDKKFQPNLYFLQNITSGESIQTKLINKSEGELESFEGEIYQQFEENLKETITQMMSNDDFKQTNNEDTCKYCDFRNFCENSVIKDIDE